MTDVTFSDEELQLIRRVLHFAEGDLPIKDGKGNSLYPVLSTIEMADRLITRLDQAGVQVPAGLYSPFDPLSLEGKTATVWQEAQTSDEYTIQVRGKVTSVRGSDSDGWYVALGNTTLGPYRREDLKASSQIEMDLPQ